MSVVHLGGNDLFYVRSGGEGAVVTLIHGAGGNHLVWPAALRRLPDATVYALDLPGHGRSQGAGRERIEDYAADLLGFLDAVQVERTVLVGHSLGGAIAQELALAAPDRVTGLVLVSTGARLRVSAALLAGLERDFEGAVRLITQWAWGPEADPALVAQGLQVMMETGPQVLLRDFLACDRFDARGRVVEIAAPTMVLTGSEDRLTPPRLGQWLADHVPGARFSLVTGAGHMLMLERPVEVAAALEAFLP